MEKIKITDPNVTSELPHRYLLFFGILWFMFWVINSLTSVKTFNFVGLLWSVGTITYPFTYIFDDIFTEVYGYRVSRKVIWSGFFAFFVMSIVGYLYSLIPSDPSFQNDAALNFVFHNSPFVVLAALLGFSSGEFTNSVILARMKVYTFGKYESVRYIASTFFGQLVDNSIFNIVAITFLGWYSWNQFVDLTLTVVTFCTLYEVLMLPATKRVINWIKEKEGIDTYDHGTNFNPFKLG